MKYEEKENSNLKREVKSLVTRNQNLTVENNKLKNYIDVILEAIKKFFRKILQFGNEYAKDETTIEVKNYYGNEYFDMEDYHEVLLNKMNYLTMLMHQIITRKESKLFLIMIRQMTWIYVDKNNFNHSNKNLKKE